LHGSAQIFGPARTTSGANMDQSNLFDCYLARGKKLAPTIPFPNLTQRVISPEKTKSAFMRNKSEVCQVTFIGPFNTKNKHFKFIMPRS
jgi:hypothetical protein